MKIKVKRRLIVVLLLLVMALLTACGNSKKATVDSVGQKETTAVEVKTKNEESKESSKTTAESKTPVNGNQGKTDAVNTEARKEGTGEPDEPAYSETEITYTLEEYFEPGTNAFTEETEKQESTYPVEPEAPGKSTCTFTIDGGGNTGIIFSGTMEFEEGYTVYDLLCNTGQSIEGSGSYITAINGLKERGHGPMSGWLYTVNGMTPMISCGSYYPEDNDEICWYYQYDE